MALAWEEVLEVLETLVFSVPWYVTFVFVAILVVTFGLIVTEKINKTLVAIVGAAATLGAGKIFSFVYSWVPIVRQILTGVPHELLFSDHEVFAEMIEWETLFIIVSVTIIAVVAERSGLFEYISIRVVQFSGGNFQRLFLYLCLITFILTMILGNDPAFILMGALTIVVSRTMGKNPIPYVLGAVLISNTAGASTAVASFVNILVTAFYGYDPFFYLSYPSFVVLGLPFAFITTSVGIVFFLLFFRKDFQRPKDEKTLQETKEMLEQFDPSTVIKDRPLFRRTTYLLIITIAGFIIGGLIGIPFYLISLIAAGAFLLADIKEFKSNIVKVDWKLILFFIGIFIIIGGVDRTGILSRLGESIGYMTLGNSYGASGVLVMFSGMLSGLLDNVSVTATLLYIVPSISSTAFVSERLIIWSILYGANMGANLTPIGGIPNIIAFSLLEEENIAISWKGFLKIGVPITLITLISGILILGLFNNLFGWNFFEELLFKIMIPSG
ncbi:MAG: SLC13 family permease [Candidatus Lokiarchaeia archaeon]